MSVIVCEEVIRFSTAFLFVKGDIVIYSFDGSGYDGAIGIVDGSCGSRVRVRVWSRGNRNFVDYALAFNPIELAIIGHIKD